MMENSVSPPPSLAAEPKLTTIKEGLLKKSAPSKKLFHTNTHDNDFPFSLYLRIIYMGTITSTQLFSSLVLIATYVLQLTDKYRQKNLAGC